MKTDIYKIRRIAAILLLCMAMIAGNRLAATAQKPGSPRAKTVHQKHKQKKSQAKHQAHFYYRNLPKRGYVVNALPSGVIAIHSSSGALHYHNGVFYQPRGAAGFAVVRAPIGVHVKVLPASQKKIVVRGKTYVYYYGTFYSKAEGSDEFEVVEAPEGAEVDAIPEGYDTEEIDGVVYYTLDDVRYRENLKNGEPVYEVVK